MIRKEQGCLDWNLGAEEIDARVRAYNPWPFCFTHWNGEELYIIEGKKVTDTILGTIPGLVSGVGGQGILIQTGDGVYAVSRLQRKAKKAFDWKTFLNGARDFIGCRLGSVD
jgi:methionyl-tRNA formyltransferase